MTAIASVIPQAATFTYHFKGVELLISWDDMADALLAAEIGDHLVMPQVNEPLTPTIAFGAGVDGFYSGSAGTINVAIAGVARYTFNASGIASGSSNGFVLPIGNSSATFPTLVNNKADLDTGIGGAPNALANISGGVSAVIYKSDGTDVIQQVEANVGLTADVGSAQGNGVITSSYNVYDTVGSAGDAATLPAVFGVGDLVYVKNDAAVNSMDVFPASGDDAGGGADTAVAVAAGDFAVFMGTAANSAWTKISGGTA